MVDNVRLLPQPELLDQRPVAVGVTRLEIVEELTTSRHHAKQSAPRMVVLDVDLEMLVQSVDAGGEQRGLHLRRAGVALRALIVGDHPRLVCNRDGHVRNSSLCPLLEKTAIIARKMLTIQPGSRLDPRAWRPFAGASRPVRTPP